MNNQENKKDKTFIHQPKVGIKDFVFADQTTQKDPNRITDKIHLVKYKGKP